MEKRERARYFFVRNYTFSIISRADIRYRFLIPPYLVVVNYVETAEKIPRKISVAVNQHQYCIQRPVFVFDYYGIIAYARNIFVALFKTAGRIRAIKIGKFAFGKFCPDLAVVIAEYESPLHAETFHKVGKFFCGFPIIVTAAAEPHRINEVARNDYKIGVCRFYDFFNRGQRKLVFFSRKKPRAYMNVGKL